MSKKKRKWLLLDCGRVQPFGLENINKKTKILELQLLYKLKGLIIETKKFIEIKYDSYEANEGKSTM